MQHSELQYQNRVQLSKLLNTAHNVRMIIAGCLDNLTPDQDMHYELGEINSGPDLEKRIRLGHFLQMTLPGKPILEDIDDFFTTESEFDPDCWENFVDHLALIRRTSTALDEGDYYPLTLHNPDVFGFVRQTELQRMVVMVNCSERVLNMRTPALTGNWVAGTDWVTGSGDQPDHEIELNRYEGRLFETRKALK
jgi:hypothetical protein